MHSERLQVQQISISGLKLRVVFLPLYAMPPPSVCLAYTSPSLTFVAIVLAYFPEWTRLAPVAPRRTQAQAAEVGDHPARWPSCNDTSP